MPMPALSIEDRDELMRLIEANPGVDIEQVKALLEVLQERDRLGLPPANRTPIPPVERQRVVVGESEESDPRTIRLGVQR